MIVTDGKSRVFTFSSCDSNILRCLRTINENLQSSNQVLRVYFSYCVKNDLVALVLIHHIFTELDSEPSFPLFPTCCSNHP